MASSLFLPVYLSHDLIGCAQHQNYDTSVQDIFIFVVAVIRPPITTRTLFSSSGWPNYFVARLLFVLLVLWADFAGDEDADHEDEEHGVVEAVEGEDVRAELFHDFWKSHFLIIDILTEDNALTLAAMTSDCCVRALQLRIIQEFDRFVACDVWMTRVHRELLVLYLSAFSKNDIPEESGAQISCLRVILKLYDLLHHSGDHQWAQNL